MKNLNVALTGIVTSDTVLVSGDPHLARRIIMNEFSTMQERAAKLLERWAMATGKYWHPVNDDVALGCYGPGYLTWGVQSNLNYAGAIATLAMKTTPPNKAKWRDRALSAMRFALATHVTGRRPGNDGKPWGNSWISMLGIERAMHGLSAMAGEFSTSDHDDLRRVLISEADWLLLHAANEKNAGVGAGLWSSSEHNEPESNIWSGSLLWRVAGMYPEEAHAAAWKDQAHRYLVNGVSVEADALDSTLIAGRPVSDWHVGANFFPHYALDHHGYMNVGYMVICTSNAAMLYFDLKRKGLKPPESLFHHQADLWQILRSMIFEDGRLARIGGDTRVRYAYCQEYLLPSLLFAADYHKDQHALQLAERQMTLIEREAEGGDGTFYGQRLEHLRTNNPHYYTRIESDRACVMAMLLNYLPLVQAPGAPAGTFAESIVGEWIEQAHGAVMHRSPGRLSSFAWRAYGLTQALCLPPDNGNLAEWSSNLCPVVRFLGDNGTHPDAYRRLLAQHIDSFDGGFVTCGSVMEGVNVNIDEGAACTDQAATHIAFAALPDNKTCLCLQYVKAAVGRVGYLVELKDLHLAVPNDLLNGSRRTLRSTAGQTVLVSPPERSETLEFQGCWLNIDDCLGVVTLYGGDRMLVDRSASRRGGRYQSIFVEEVCLHVNNGVVRCQDGEVLADAGFAVLSGATSEETARVNGGAISFSQKELRGVWVESAYGQRYALVANFGNAVQTAVVFEKTIELAPGAAMVVGVKC